jgi:hypothetical protein
MHSEIEGIVLYNIVIAMLYMIPGVMHSAVRVLHSVHSFAIGTSSNGTKLVSGIVGWSLFRDFKCIEQWRSQVGAQGARAPPSAPGLVDIVYRKASSSTPVAIPNYQLLFIKEQLRGQLKTYLIPRFGRKH